MDDSQRAASASAPQSDKSWVTVAKVDGMIQASLAVNYLRAHGFTALAWQEGAGQALGLTVGYLGTAHVLAPPQEAEEARACLAALSREEADGESAPVDCPHCGEALLLNAEELSHGWYVCPACRLAALILESVTCPHCYAELALSDDELARQSFECPQCAHHVAMA